MNKVITFLTLTYLLSQSVAGQTADFTYESTSGFYCNPSIIKFRQISTGSPIGFIWSFGNNSGSNQANPITVYNTAGTYQVKLIVVYRKSTLQVTKSITINPGMQVNIGIDRNNLCNPGTVNFRANTSSALSVNTWDFGDQSGTISSESPVLSHNFTSFGTYIISLRSTAPTGCFGQASTIVKIERPAIEATVTPQSGCIPRIASFNANVNYLNQANNITYTWNFGDGSPPKITSNPSTSHAYTTAGNYTPILQAVTQEGCSNSFTFPVLAFGYPPTGISAYARERSICGSDSATFVAVSNGANKYFWDFGQNDTISVADTIMKHKFRSLGTKNITVTPYYNDCPGTPATLSIDVIGVIAGFSYANTCNDKKTFSFTNISQGNLSSLSWETGDGSPLQFTPAGIVHTYPDTGTFRALIRISDSITRCSDIFGAFIYTANPGFSSSSNVVCKQSENTFSIPDNYNNPRALYTWHVIGNDIGPVSKDSLTLHAAVHGNFDNNYVIINNGPQYCTDTVKLNTSIIVKGPILDFEAPPTLCLGSPFKVINRSASYVPSDIISTWQWNYGIPGAENSNRYPMPYLYPNWGTFNVTLKATDVNGCTDTLMKPVKVFETPFLLSIHDKDSICAGQSLTMIAFHNDPIIWEPSGSLNCTSCDTVIASPSASTTYYLKTTNRYHCSKSDSIHIKVIEPFTAIAKKNDHTICKNESVQLEVSPPGKKISWYPVTGLSDSTKLNPKASPSQSTEYIATLTDSAGCFSSSTRINVLVNPLPTVDAGPDKYYAYNTPFMLTPLVSNDVRSYAWSPASLLSCSDCPRPEGISNTTETYLVTVTNNSGCMAKDNVTIYVECKGANLLLPTAFTPNNDGQNDYYYPITRGIRKIVRFVIYNQWGQMVYETKDILPNNKLSGWDGNYKGMPQQSAAYVYTLETICDAGQTLSKNGSFLLIR